MPSHKWLLKKLEKNATAIQARLGFFKPMKDAQLADYYQTILKEKRASGVKLSSLSVDTFALVSEVAYRALGLRAYDVQLMGAQALASGKIAEMKTGEGKTLVAAFTASLWALDKDAAVHVVTTNDYLANRDAQTLRPLYEGLGLTVGVVYSQQSREEKIKAYQCDIIYGTSSEFGFDYLRENMVLSQEDKINARTHAYAVIDEVDSLLIDEARTPLVISGPSDEEQVALYEASNQIALEMKRQQEEEGEGDYWVDEKERQVHLSEQGQRHAENAFIRRGLLDSNGNLYLPESLDLLHHLDVALRAHTLLHKDVNYVLRTDEQGTQVIIVDSLTGRAQPGRRWNNGIHQAVEMKEGLRPLPESSILASIAIQHYFGTYQKLAGMTGTARTEEREFNEIYGLKVVEIPTHREIKRIDYSDVICVNKKDKLRRIVREIESIHALGRPILVGTPSVSASEELAVLLREKGLSFAMLNAKNHLEEAKIIAQAGEKGAITLATSMAGRGTDILLGGSLEHALKELGDEATAPQKEAVRIEWERRHNEVVSLGGLHVIGSERQESRRVDNQLRGRAGRQGDPGSSRFYLAMDDDLLRVFASPALRSIFAMLGLSEGATIENERITRQIENAQRQMEVFNYNSRKSLLDYDNVIHDQRLFVYAERNRLLKKKFLQNEEAWEQVEWLAFQGWREESMTADEAKSWGETWNIPHDLKLESALSFEDWVDTHWERTESFAQRKQIAAQYLRFAFDRLNPQDAAHQQTNVQILIESLDHQWRQHLDRLALIRQGIGLRGYAQKQPVQEYKKDAHQSFMYALESARMVSAQRWLGVSAPWEKRPSQEWETPTSRNALCPCGSGKKYKHCHGSLAQPFDYSHFVLNK